MLQLTHSQAIEHPAHGSPPLSRSLIAHSSRFDDLLVRGKRDLGEDNPDVVVDHLIFRGKHDNYLGSSHL